MSMPMHAVSTLLGERDRQTDASICPALKLTLSSYRLAPHLGVQPFVASVGGRRLRLHWSNVSSGGNEIVSSSGLAETTKILFGGTEILYPGGAGSSSRISAGGSTLKVRVLHGLK